MISLLRSLISPKHNRASIELAEAQQDWRACKARGDTRGMGNAIRRASAAMPSVLAQEIRR